MVGRWLGPEETALHSRDGSIESQRFWLEDGWVPRRPLYTLEMVLSQVHQMICLIYFPTQHSAVIFLSKGEEDDKISFLNCTQGWREEMMAVTRQKEMSVTWQAFVASAEIC